MSKSDNTIRPMSRGEMDFAVQMAANEGWDPGLHDAEYFYRTDPQGFLIGLQGNKPAGCISAVSYGGKFGFIGFYVVLPEYRSGWMGFRLGRAALARLADQNTGLDGVVEKVEHYRRIGFSPVYSNIRFEYRHGQLPAINQSGIVKLQEVPFQAVQNYDRRCFPAERTIFLEGWLRMPDSNALGYVQSGKLRGYGVIRKCRQGYKIGPLFADDAAIAESLYLNLISGTEEKSAIYLDIPEVNPAAVALTKKYQMKQVFSTVRMYSKEKPDIDLKRIFGITSFELG